MINNRIYYKNYSLLSFQFIFKVVFISSFFSFGSLAEVEYEMSISNSVIINDNIYEFDIKIKSLNESFILTSYQASFGFNQNIINNGEISFSFIEGTSDLQNEPSIGLGVNGTDGSLELTFASLPGEENIDTNLMRVGRFRLENTNSFESSNINTIWNFEGSITTILTGESFTDITNPNYHKNEFVNFEAVIDTFYMTLNTDDIMYYNGSTNSNVSRFGETDNVYRGIEQIYKNITIPQNAEIISAQIEVKANTSTSGTADADIYSDLRDNPTSVMSYSDYIGNTNFSSVTYQYSAPPYTAGTFYQIDITNVIQDRVNKPTWANGDNLGIIIKGNAALSASFFREITRAENSLTDNKLIITYFGQPTDIEDGDDIELSENFELSQNYPNPFNPTTQIRFSLPEDGKVKLMVFNILGEVVSELINQELSRGTHDISFDGGNLASGIYVYRLDIENQFTDIKKMILMK